MPSLAELMEDYRNWRGRSEWEQGKAIQDIYGGDPTGQERFERFGGFGTGSHGVGGLAGMIKASHGSPHAFERFDFTKIGTGEGAQAYGHGGYFAQGFDSPVAKQYSDAGVKYSPALESVIDSHKGDLDSARKGLIEAINLGDTKWQSQLDELDAVKPNLYNVELKWPDPAREAADPLGEHHLLDWDAPMSKQSPTIQKAWLATQKDLPANAVDDLGGDLSLLYGKDVTPDEFLGTLSSIGGNPGFGEQLLRKQGIPGIRYLDQASRGAGTGSRNYVMFDDQFPNIVSRNGVSLSDLLRR